jgi:copper homeostasis protein
MVFFNKTSCIINYSYGFYLKQAEMKFELCTDSVEGAIKASQYGFTSIELCSALTVGGLTPNFGLIKQCVNKTEIEVHVMIRHREGDFVCHQEDVDLMKIDIEAVKRAGAHGVVFGLLDEDHRVSDFNEQLIDLARSLKLKATFHRAFDFVPDYRSAIKKIVGLGFDRLLTSGLKARALEGLDVIKELQKNYGDGIQIIAGSGVNETNALIFAKAGIDYLHFTARKSSGERVSLDMGQLMITDEQKIKSILGLSFD